MAATQDTSLRPPYGEGDYIVDTVGGGLPSEHRVLRCEPADLVLIAGYRWKVTFRAEDGGDAVAIVGDDGRDPWGHAWPLHRRDEQPRVMAVAGNTATATLDHADLVQIPATRIAEILHELTQVDDWRLLLDELADAWTAREELDDQSCPSGTRQDREAALDNAIFEIEETLIARLGIQYMQVPGSRRLRLFRGGEPQ